MSCPICGKPTDRTMRPFCSRRCARIDLGKWLSGEYAVPSTDPEDVEAALDATLERDTDPDGKPH
ncbi:DNA gyrase inhibitor YacG [Roseovarius sp. SCSIO 43702]|uniref:DNA gyrase inhibitor YacG n=1 Tax=Roseovarius sp. SCSIO 43702 TaxID=2823043 RepID=UPI001C73581F|nr:DNA gyrase inhibitor YacG [Roseovarius sp. SCSIO 43702]QYX56023.1 DNA gyrase inhibitor YacG [Roseovarius sp. SCSIO 43702]